MRAEIGNTITTQEVGYYFIITEYHAPFDNIVHFIYKPTLLFDKPNVTIWHGILIHSLWYCNLMKVLRLWQISSTCKRGLYVIVYKGINDELLFRSFSFLLYVI